ncbi:MAG: cytochrome b [Pseudomonadota bacterium]
MTQAQLHYNRVARTLHWTIGALIIVNLILGIFGEALGDAIPAMPIHKSIGLTVLALSLFRLAWRLTHPAPPLPASVPMWERVSAQTLHWTFYALMIVMPMTGWIFSSAGKSPLTFFFLFDVPKLAVEKGSALAAGAHSAHEVLGFVWAALLLLHVAAALRHQFVLKNGILNRIWRSAPRG